jgi:hypothetical protein
MGLEGIVSKRLTAPYRSGPSRDWIKVKNPDSPAMRRAAARASLAANRRCPRSSRFEPSASHRMRIARVSIMQRG